MGFSTFPRRVWGWFFFDWASQPYNTLLITFIFAPYIKELIGDGAKAQTVWATGIAVAGIIIALGAPILGALADHSGARMQWIKVFSVMYVIGAFGIWWATPYDLNLVLVLGFFVIGMIGMEFATIFTNSMLPDIGDRSEIGRISGTGWAFGYVGGLAALMVMLLFFAESASTGKTLLGHDPAFGFDAAQREGTRFVGPLTGFWYILFMVPFFLWVKEPAPKRGGAMAVRRALGSVARTVRHLPKTPSMFAYLASSMFYRDALNGMYFFGGIYAAGVLGWDVVQTGTFGILALISGAVFAWLGGHADDRFGPKPVIVSAILALLLVAVSIVFISRTRVYGIALAPGSVLPDVLFYLCGAVIGAAGGVIQSASRTMMVRQARPGHMAESFGLYGLAGKATAFIAPALIGVVTAATGSQQIGVSPLIGLFLIGLVLLVWVKPQGDSAE
ncbi:MFS transporter [Roseovarius sp. M141]|uniref:MFS transporter n=1 Tax=Roseovarius sp. M141 TaxID=2583806 RepID=UPI0020CB9441|nr:MFS transporter [Roseovarius sp. M141]MCQ0091007.1 MFS transporter [Roseovarius sp. M141]